MWIPPFMLNGERTEEFAKGITVWHVKQKEDGISWFLAPDSLTPSIAVGCQQL